MRGNTQRESAEALNLAASYLAHIDGREIGLNCIQARESLLGPHYLRSVSVDYEK